MAIMGIVMTGLTTIFVSGSKAELDLEPALPGAGGRAPRARQASAATSTARTGVTLVTPRTHAHAQGYSLRRRRQLVHRRRRRIEHAATRSIARPARPAARPAGRSVADYLTTANVFTTFTHADGIARGGVTSTSRSASSGSRSGRTSSRTRSTSGTRRGPSGRPPASLNSGTPVPIRPAWTSRSQGSSSRPASRSAAS